jgi:hypothetical protein
VNLRVRWFSFHPQSNWDSFRVADKPTELPPFVDASAFPSTDLVKLPTSRLLARNNFRVARDPPGTDMPR